MLTPGDKLLIAHRRLFREDENRYFVGTVDAYEAGIVRVTGRSFIRDMMSGRLIVKEGNRTKLISISSGTLFIYLLPHEVRLDSLHFKFEDAQLLLTDGQKFTMNLTEYPHLGKL